MTRFDEAAGRCVAPAWAWAEESNVSGLGYLSYRGLALGAVATVGALDSHLKLSMTTEESSTPSPES